MEKVLSIQNLSKGFGSSYAVKDLSFDVFKGDVCGILGLNGSAKSTTLGIILNAIKASSGHWSWFGGRAGKDHRKRIGALVERPNFHPCLNAVDNLKNRRWIKGRPLREMSNKCLKHLKLYTYRKISFERLSLDMKQGLAIASALIAEPDVLALDEPTNGLDPEGIVEIRYMICGIAAEEKTISLASHLLDEVEKACDRVVVIQKGKGAPQVSALI